MLVAHCQVCDKILIVPIDTEPLNPYVVALGYKRTGRYTHELCLHLSLAT